jgi:hypothetical protein
MGKYLNGYPLTTYVPPGWDEWYGVAGGINFFNYSLNENGNLVRYGSEPEAYLTDVLREKAADFILRTIRVSPFHVRGLCATPAATRRQTSGSFLASGYAPSFNE